jgi:hypothetical protein
MLEHHLKSAVTQQRLRSGPAADYIDDFADWLHRHGYRPVTIDTTQRSVHLPVGRIGCERRGSPRMTCSEGSRPVRRNSRGITACDTAAAPMTTR